MATWQRKIECMNSCRKFVTGRKFFGQIRVKYPLEPQKITCHLCRQQQMTHFFKTFDASIHTAIYAGPEHVISAL